jgi:hypothetical protein
MVSLMLAVAEIPSKSPSSVISDIILTFMSRQKISKAAVKRDCWECGKVCAACAPLAARTCKRCKSDYCIFHNDGCDDTTVCTSCNLLLMRQYKRKRLMMDEFL